MILLYNILLLSAAALSSPWWLLQLCLRPKYRHALGRRLGAVPPGLREFAANRRIVWLHAVSVGETMAAAPFVETLKSQIGGEFSLVVSTTTATGNQVARSLFGAESVFYCPLDFPWAVARYIKAIRPAALVLMESELWPNLITQAHVAGASVVVLNARVSDRSYPRYCRMRWFWTKVYASITAFLASSELDARRLYAMGVPANRIHVTGNMKFDLERQDSAPLLDMLRSALPADAPVLICGSTLEREERELLHSVRRIRAFVPDLVTILAPRHPERFDAVAKQMPAGTIRRTRWNGDAIPAGGYFLLDTVGELPSIYPAGTAAFVGGSLVPAGGHNPLEPAMAGLPIVMGFSVENFRAVVGVLERAGALTCVLPEDLTDTLMKLVRDRRMAAELGRRGMVAMEANRGATERSASFVIALLAAHA